MSSKSPPLDERLHFIKHKGQAVYVIDLSHCEAKEILVLLNMVRADVARHPHGSMLILTDFAGAHIDKAVATRAKEVLVFDRPYVKRSAWVGTESLPHVYLRELQELFAAGPADVQDAGRGDGLAGSGRKPGVTGISFTPFGLAGKSARPTRSTSPLQRHRAGHGMLHF
jgi:hypothetical protein